MSTECRELNVDKEFLSLCGNQTAEELSLLEAGLDRDGCLDPIILWAGHQDTILDGHTRYRMCRDLGIKFATTAPARSRGAGRH